MKKQKPRHRREQKPFSRQRSKEMLTTSGTTFLIGLVSCKWQCNLNFQLFGNWIKIDQTAQK